MDGSRRFDSRRLGEFWRVRTKQFFGFQKNDERRENAVAGCSGNVSASGVSAASSGLRSLFSALPLLDKGLLLVASTLLKVRASYIAAFARVMVF
jgi:hypothetical protein